MVDKVLEIPRLPQFDVARLIEKRPGPNASTTELASYAADTTEYLRRLNVCLVEWFEQWAASTNTIIEEVENGGSFPDAQYVVMDYNGTLANERKLTAGSGITITDGGANSTVTIAASSGLSGTSTIVLWGNGEDGDAVLDGTNTYSWASKSGNFYWLTKNVMLNNLTVDAGITLYPDGCALRCLGTLTNNGTISAAGEDANDNLVGPGNGAAGSGGQSSGGTYSSSSAAGGSNGNLNGAGNNSSTQSPSIGGRGGNGGSVGGTAGGTSGNATPPVKNDGGIAACYTIHFIETGTILGAGNNSSQPVRGGSGGASGGADNGNNGYAGGGGGAGWLMGIICRLITGSGLFDASGGDGGNAAQFANTGGGGGGGGGAILVVTTSTNYASTMTRTVAGGAGGAGFGTGNAGSAGASGRIIEMFIT